ncbi:MAG: ATP-binding cassette domain-containing protein [Candidatus Theseobacter exili]|nr:ATP-binding cassette domain-containing protein [Candidatus Theseobacter exili]
MKIIEISALQKTYRINKKKKGVKGIISNLFRPEYVFKKAVNNISFDIEQGDIVGLIGPNGAGKSSLIKMLVGIMKPDAGSVKVFGYEPFRQRRLYTKNIGVVFGQRSSLWWDLSVIDSFELLRKIYKVPDAQYDETLAYLVKTFDLQSLLHQPVRMLSLGQKLRCTIASAMLHSPDILFLDEPTIGLDVLSIDQLLSILEKMNRERQTTIFITSHDLNVVERLCRRILLVYNGEILFNGSFPDAIKRFNTYKRLRLSLSNKDKLSELVEKLPSELKVESSNETQLVLVFNHQELSYDRLLDFLRLLLLDKSTGLYEFYLEKPDLNELILTLFYSYRKDNK